MGHGTWTRAHFETYTRAAGRTVDAKGNVSGNYTAQEMFKNRGLAPALNPKGVIRECCETAEHPNTIPVIFALDVTGSMGSSAVEFAKKLNTIMTDLFTKVKDVEFLIMGIGDFMYDQVPLQASQFESDVRIAEQLDQLYFEGGGGGNGYESYTAAWYFAANHTRLDCWKRGQKGILITIGDELLNPYIPLQGRRVNFQNYLGDPQETDIETEQLLNEVLPKYDVYHLVADHSMYAHNRVNQNVKSFEKYLGPEHVSVVTVNTLAEKIVDIIVAFAAENRRKAAEPTTSWIEHAAATPPTTAADNTAAADPVDRTAGVNFNNTAQTNNTRGGWFANLLGSITW